MFSRFSILILVGCASASTAYAGDVVLHASGCLDAFGGSRGRVTITSNPSFASGTLPQNTLVTVTFQADPGYVLTAYYWANGDQADLGNCGLAHITSTGFSTNTDSASVNISTGTWEGHEFGAKAVRVSRVNTITTIGQGRVTAAPLLIGTKFRWDLLPLNSIGEHVYYICAIPNAGWYVDDWILNPPPQRADLESNTVSRFFNQITFADFTLDETDNVWDAGLRILFQPLPVDPIVELSPSPPPIDGLETSNGGAGTSSRPIVGLNNAAAIVADGSTLRIMPGSTSETVTIDRPMTLTVEGTGTVIIGVQEVMTRKKATSGFISGSHR